MTGLWHQSVARSVQYEQSSPGQAPVEYAVRAGHAHPHILLKSGYRMRLDFKVHGFRPDPRSSPVIEGFRRQDFDGHRKDIFEDVRGIHKCVDGFAALVEFQREVDIRIGTGIAPRGRSEESDTPHTEILERGCDAPYEGCRFGYFGLIEVLKEVNSEIRDEDYHLGISFFLTAGGLDTGERRADAGTQALSGGVLLRPAGQAQPLPVGCHQG